MNRNRLRLVMLPLSESQLPAAEAVLHAYRKSFPEAPGLRVSDAPAADAEREAPRDLVEFNTPTATFTVALMRAPMPWTELSEPCAYAWYWPAAATTLRPHKAHLLVTASSAHQDAIELMLSLTRVVAAVAQCAPALGVYLGGAGQVHKVDDFVSEAEGATRELLPLYLWIRFTIRPESNERLSLFTTGLAELEHMEVEFTPSRLEAQHLMDRAFNIAHYLLDHGAVLAHGHTIGISNDEKFKVAHVPSTRGSAEAQLVYALTLL